MSEVIKTGAAAHNQPTVLRPQNMNELMAFAQLAAKSSMMPRDYLGKPENVVIAVQLGSELGLAPMQSIQNIAVISGRPAVFGDAMPALCRQSAVCEDIEERFEGDGEQLTAVCVAKRVGKKPITQTFSVDDAKKAGLWGKAGPWQQYPKRMLQMRARGFALRDAFPDVLRGLISIEEAQDIPADPPFTGTTTHGGPTIEGTASSERDAINAEVPIRAAAATTQRAARIAEQAPAYDTPRAEAPQPRRMTWPELLDGFNLALKDAGTAEEIDHILRSNQMTEAKAHIGVARPEYQRRFDEIMVMADERRTALEDDAAEAAVPEEDEVVIAGAANVGAG